ncbi:MAG: hypothetical protein ACR2FF_08760 [Mycobacteriales bacterium]
MKRVDLARLRSVVQATELFLFATSSSLSVDGADRQPALQSGIADGVAERALVQRNFMGRRSTHLFESDGRAYSSVDHGNSWVSFGLPDIDVRSGPLGFWLITKRIAADCVITGHLDIPAGREFAGGWVPPWNLGGFRHRNALFWRPFLQYAWMEDENGRVAQVAFRWTWSPQQRRGRWMITGLDHDVDSLTIPDRPIESSVLRPSEVTAWRPGNPFFGELDDRLDVLGHRK